MIIGIGSDLIDITRVAKVIERHGDRFLDRIFTDAERAKAGRRAKSETALDCAVSLEIDGSSRCYCASSNVIETVAVTVADPV